jgi:ankyrin repeat protein
LHVTIERNKARLFQLLLSKGAHPTGQNDNYDGWSPLMLAVHWKRDKMVTALLEAGARQGLPEALMLGNDKLVEDMLSNDPEIAFDTMPNNGSPLHFCATAKSVDLLIEIGVDPHQTSQYGTTPLDSAVGSKGDKKAVIDALRKHLGSDATNAGHLAAMGDLKGLQSWLSYHPDGLTKFLPFSGIHNLSSISPLNGGTRILFLG